MFVRYLIWLATLPPLFLYIGASRGGWHLGAAEPLFPEPKARLVLGAVRLQLFGEYQMTIMNIENVTIACRNAPLEGTTG